MPKLSIILPTYNRAKFLPKALMTIESQTFTDWELILVDDGSTDNTKAHLDSFSSTVKQRVRYIYQKNSGAYAAREHGISLATSEYVAFFDSDDLWLPHHLNDCINVLRSRSEVGWVAARDHQVCDDNIDINDTTALTMQELPKALLKLRSETDGLVQIFKDPSLVRVLLQTEHSCGLQRSVIRRSIFSRTLFRGEQRNGEDRMFLIRAIKDGCTLAYLHKCNLIYQIHDSNSSAVSPKKESEAKARVYEAVIQGYEDLLQDVSLTRSEKRALRRRVSSDIFWKRGFHCFWKQGLDKQAFLEFERAISRAPYDLSLRKSHLLFKARRALPWIK